MSTTEQDQRTPLVVPPRLRTSQTAEASRLELFFDLAYVLVVLELASTFLKDLTLAGFVELGGLYVALWFSWVGFTMYANRFDTDDVVLRVAKLGATLAVAGCAASASGATSTYSLPFAACFLLGRLLLVLLYARAWRHVEEARPTLTIYLASTSVSAALWAVSFSIDGPSRYWWWTVAVLVDAAAPVVATVAKQDLPVHVEHLPERFGLFVILVLGEAVGGAATGVHDAGWVRASVLVGVAGFVVAGALWWTYFDAVSAGTRSAIDADDDGNPHGEETDERHDLFVYGHLPLTLGVVMVGVGVEELVLHPGDALPSAGSWVLTAGAALFVLGSALIVAGSQRALRSVVPEPLLALLLLGAVAVVPHRSALLTVGAVAVVALALAVRGTWTRHREPQREGGI